jgi:hypothetical protein
MTPTVNTDTFGRAALNMELTTDEKRVPIPYFDTRHNLTGGGGYPAVRACPVRIFQIWV